MVLVQNIVVGLLSKACSGQCLFPLVKGMDGGFIEEFVQNYTKNSYS